MTDKEKLERYEKRILGLDQNTTKEIILKIGGHVGNAEQRCPVV